MNATIMDQDINKVFQKFVSWTRLNQFTEEIKPTCPIIVESRLAQLWPSYKQGFPKDCIMD